ncbi:DUF1428 family protein [Bdellovibrio sp. NC01]|uniref:DUF1428 family protein n=1 Tax=Bdellovibrio sp. NC01 TaxID=2220073 RepID=UPI00143CF64A|nr:DUF1428 family protein [Bdellovibrio sp. NC01]
MAKQYLDLCIMPVPKTKIAAYTKTTKIIGKLLLKHGALASRDYMADDENASSLSFPKKIKLKKGEVIVVAEAVFKSKAHRDSVFKKMFKDPKMEQLNMGPEWMDQKRCVVGGFTMIANVE